MLTGERDLETRQRRMKEEERGESIKSMNIVSMLDLQLRQLISNIAKHIQKMDFEMREIETNKEIIDDNIEDDDDIDIDNI